MPIASMSASRARGFHAPSFIGWRTLASSSPTASQVMPGRQMAWRGRLGFMVSRTTSPLILRYEFVSPSCRHSACLPSTRNSGSRYFSHSSGGSTTWESLSNTATCLEMVVMVRDRSAAGCYHTVTEASAASAALTSSSVGHQLGRSISVTRSRMIFFGGSIR